MIRPTWAGVAGVALLGTVGVVGAVIVASPGGDEEVVQQVATASASAAPTSSAAPSPTQSTIPTATASADPTASPVSEDWATYSDPQGLYSFQYPSAWHIGTGGKRSVIATSWDTATWTSPQFPPNSMKVDVIVAPVEQAEARPDGATDSTLLGGEPGWEAVYTYDPSTTGGVTRAHQVAADHGSYRYSVTCMFAQDRPDEETLVAIARSFTFGQ